ncbi:hypothetical protein [Streptomyces griseosporeus]|uniref:hypothetical protein n=1 Tax=Streptomyces griseosporeus TaxID=1910 RepID=UPI00167E895F|nr:hypothetical protein [Streptomyces griseosporeus]GHF92211.1 hypothetical protein GCM10018783_73830 [Streptomyces griseosporeus]
MVVRHIISVDPGDVHNGFCYFKHNDETGKADLKIREVLSGKQLSDMLKVIWGMAQVKEPGENEKNPFNMFFVVENFRVDTKSRGAIFQWKEMLTSEAIGRVKLCAEWAGAPVIMQEPSILPMGRKYSPWPVPKGHIPDDISAFIHGTHFMITKRLIRTTDDITLFGQDRL